MSGSLKIGAKATAADQLTAPDDNKAAMQPAGIKAETKQLKAKASLFEALEKSYGSDVAAEVFTLRGFEDLLFSDQPLTSKMATEIEEAAKELASLLTNQSDQPSSPSPANPSNDAATQKGQFTQDDPLGDEDDSNVFNPLNDKGYSETLGKMTGDAVSAELKEKAAAKLVTRSEDQPAQPKRAKIDVNDLDRPDPPQRHASEDDLKARLDKLGPKVEVDESNAEETHTEEADVDLPEPPQHLRNENDLDLPDAPDNKPKPSDAARQAYLQEHYRGGAGDRMVLGQQLWNRIDDKAHSYFGNLMRNALGADWTTKFGHMKPHDGLHGGSDPTFEETFKKAENGLTDHLTKADIENAVLHGFADARIHAKDLQRDLKKQVEIAMMAIRDLYGLNK